MTRQTVSICNCRGGVALDGEYAAQLADLLEWTLSMDPSPDTEANMGARRRFRMLIRVLRGEAPAELGEMA